MFRILAAAGLCALVATAVAGPAGATSGISSTYAIAGIETSIPTNNTSTFGGSALGSSLDAAVWTASVVHQPLSDCPFGSTTSCTISRGGSFALRSSTGAQVSGIFTGGTITPVSQQTPCGKQIFSVAGTLDTTNGSGAFGATLTHYRTLFFGTCVTYFATITGSVQFGST